MWALLTFVAVVIMSTTVDKRSMDDLKTWASKVIPKKRIGFDSDPTAGWKAMQAINCSLPFSINTVGVLVIGALS